MAARKVYLVFGQSNARGHGVRSQLAPVPAWAQNAANGWEGSPTASSDSGVQYPHPTAANAPSLYNEEDTGTLSGVTDGWGPYNGCNPPFGVHPGEKSHYGAEVSFDLLHREQFPGVSLAWLKSGIGGVPIGSFLPGGTQGQILSIQIQQAKARLDASGEPWEWGGAILIHGESGAYDVYRNTIDTAMGDAFMADTRTVLAKLRADTRPDLKAVIVRVSANMLDDYAIGLQTAAEPRYTAAQFRSAVNRRRWHQEQVAADANNVLCSADGLPRLGENSGDFLHYKGAGHLALGERALAALTGYTPPPPPPPLVVKFNGTPQPWSVRLNGTPVGGTGDTIDITG
jgi:hypothetical protein